MVGVCIATSGPGATNLVTGIATAYLDSVPVVFITGNVNVNLIGKDSFQEADIAGITTPITKHNFIVKDVKDLAETVREAFDIARAGRPGPVLVDIPKNVTAESAEYTAEKIDTTKKEAPISAETEAAVEELADMIRSSKKVFCSAAAVFNSPAQMTKSIDSRDDPVSRGMHVDGRWIVSLDPHQLYRHDRHARHARNQCCPSPKAIIYRAGSRFNDRVTGDVE
jgi:acetolactate synthase-1/2/3 large subunit